MAVTPVHTAVEGRGRYRVEGLHRSEVLKRFLELRLAQETEVQQVSANPLTGNLLISFNSNNTHESIADLVERVLKEAASATDAASKSRRNRKKTTPKTKTAYPGGNGQRPVGIESAIEKLLFPHDDRIHRAWHTLKKADVLDKAQTDEIAGLTPEQVQRRLSEYGPNRLQEAERRGTWEIFYEQINTLPVYLLGAAAGVSLLTGGLIDAVVVLGVVAANAVIGCKTEGEAEKTIDSLKALVKPHAEVIRDGKIVEVPAEAVAFGDVLNLKPGSYVAADARLIQASRLSVDESMLTGESMPVNKSTRVLRKTDTSLGARTNMVFMGTQVTGGEGLAVVTATGRYTEIGRLQMLMEGTEAPRTPIERQLEKIGDHLVLLFLVICAMVLGIGFFRGYGFVQMLRMAISLAASAVPEGLPAAATINFALGINRMRQHRVLIRHLQAVETLGAVQTVCLDKTGTITRNRMTATRIFADGRRLDVDEGRITGENGAVEALADPVLEPLLRVCVLCNESRLKIDAADGRVELNGSATENALVQMAIDAGLDAQDLKNTHRFQRINHRSERRLYMSTLHRLPDDSRFFGLKGSPPEVMALCRWQMRAGEIVPLSEADRRGIEIENESMADSALRVLGFAFAQTTSERQNPEENLVWLGLVGMADPVRPGVAGLIRRFHAAGVETVMITGDQSTTAYAIARQIDLSGDQPLDILDSTQLQALSAEAIEALAKRVKVYSRVSPADKLKIVQALQAAGKTVAMTGDGINDGPALKAADIGIAMGEGGTDVAREVADIVLEDDNLETLITAVEDGRATYRNIRKSVRFFLSTNLSEIMVMFAALTGGLGFPLNVMQLLWINIISDIFPGISLSLEEPEPDVMQESPRPSDAPLFTAADYRRMTLQSAVISGASMGAYGWGLLRYGQGAQATTLAFQSLTVAQLLHALACRSEHTSMIAGNRLPNNRYLTSAVWGSLGIQLLTVVVPSLRRFLGLTPMGTLDTAIVGGSALAALLVNDTTKTVLRKARA
jgi:Ca2+-transporting ATPase